MRRLATVAYVLALSVSLVDAQEGPIKYEPLSIAALSEFGMLQGGRFGTNPRFRDVWVDHFGAFLTQGASVDNRWFLNVGLGGVFQFQKPEKLNPLWGGTQYRSFFIGPTVADVEYRVLDNAGDAAREWNVGLGMFPYKYNADASNLGEYLFRTGPYPTYIMTGNYVMINNASASLQGLKSRYNAGNLSLDVFLTTETVMPPLYDLSLAAMAKYGIAGGLIDVGLGVNFKRIVPVRPSRTTRETQENAYFKGPDGEHYSGNITYYRNRKEFYERNPGSTADSNAALATFDSVSAWTGGGAFQPNYRYYSQSGIILGGTLALDLKKLLPETGNFGPNDLRLYTEVALLGVKNYPVFYQKARERMPIMVGINLPGFRRIDLISVQYEYFPSPHLNSFYESVSTNAATPQVVPGADRVYSENGYADALSRDNHSWPVLVKKTLTRGLYVSAQAARDHTRMVSDATWAGPFLDPNEVFYTTDKNNWYWMIQFSFGI
jgi:hypothetical protein